MKKRVLLVASICLVVFIGCIFYIRLNDSLRFKMSYEFYNYVDYENGKKIIANIPFHNRIEYVNQKNLKSTMEQGSGVVYFGYSTCPWCRNAIPVLVDTVIEQQIDKIYYVDVESIDTRSIKDILEPFLDSDESGEKRLFVPDVYFMKNGEILFHHIGTVESYKDAFLGMNEEQTKELADIYRHGISLMKGEEK